MVLSKIQLTPDQEQAVNLETSVDILVSASAGSGKTRVLIERIMRKLSAGDSLANLLVVTFTEKAASEMKSRLENRLKEAIQKAESEQEQNLATHYKQQLSLIPSAYISTIDSFCRRLTQQFYYLADFDPNYRLLTDESEKALIYEDVFRQLEEENISLVMTGKENTNAMWRLLNNYTKKGNDRNAARLVFSLYDKARSQPNPKAWLLNLRQYYVVSHNFSASPYYQDVLKPQIIASLNALIAAFEGLRIKFLENRDQSWLNNLYLKLSQRALEKGKGDTSCLPGYGLDSKIAYFTKIRAAFMTSSYTKARQFVIEEDFPKTKLLAYKEVSDLIEKDDYETLKTWHQEIMKASQNKSDSTLIKEWTDKIAPLFAFSEEEQIMLISKAGDIASALIEVTLSFMERMEAYFAKEKVADFASIELRALAILEDNPKGENEARQYYQQLFSEILIDEYQDVNELQEGLFNLLSASENCHLFMVGDLKQSIYGFRYAKPDLFSNKAMIFAENQQEGVRIDLLENFRSRSEVLETTNLLFRKLMSPEIGGVQYDLRAALQVGAQDYPNEPRLQSELLLIDTPENDGEGEKSVPNIEWEARAIVQKIRQLVGQNIIYDRKTQRLRPVSYQDIVILAPSRGYYQILEQIFTRYDVPIHLDKDENYYRRTEIMLAINFLHLVDNAKQDIPLVAVLRSPLLGLSEEDLAQIRIFTPEGRFYKAIRFYLDNGPDKKIHAKLSQLTYWLEKWRLLARSAPIHELLWQIYEDTGFIEYAAGMPNGPKRENNLRTLYQYARQFESSGYRGLFSFIRYVENIYQDPNKDTSSPVLLDESANQVRVMTIHASKGLEFPIVFCFNLEKAFNEQDIRSAMVIDEKFGLGLSFQDTDLKLTYPNPLKEIIKKQQRCQLLSEELRKLYVALTRAEQKLILIAHHENVQEKIEQWRLVASQAKDELLPYFTRYQARSLLDWLGPAAFSQEDINFFAKDSALHEEAIMTYDIWSKEDITKLEALSVDFLENEEVREKEKSEFIHLDFVPFETFYPYETASKTTSHQSVSELKRLLEDPIKKEIISLEESELKFKSTQRGQRYISKELRRPRFLQEKRHVSSAEIGTATHLLMQGISLDTKPELGDFIELASQYVSKSILSSEVYNAIPFDQCSAFFDTPLGYYLTLAKDKVKREQPFALSVPANVIFGNLPGTERLLIHGTIDAFVKEKDHLVLLDYKTDRLAHLSRDQQGRILYERYQIQISLYARALETVYHLPVKRAYVVALSSMEIFTFIDQK